MDMGDNEGEGKVLRIQILNLDDYEIFVIKNKNKIYRVRICFKV